MRRIALSVLPILALAGCGEDKKPAPERSAATEVRAVVQRFAAATEVKDYQEICDELIAKSLSDNVEEFGLPCELAFRQGLDPVRDPKLLIRSVRVRGTTAKVDVHSTAANQPPSDDALELTKLPKQGWRITALGKTTRKPAPARTVTQPKTQLPPGAQPQPKVP